MRKQRDMISKDRHTYSPWTEAWYPCTNSHDPHEINAYRRHKHHLQSNKSVFQRRRYIIFTEAHSPRTKGQNINREKCRTSGGERERETLSTRTEKHDVHTEIIFTEKRYLHGQRFGVSTYRNTNIISRDRYYLHGQRDGIPKDRNTDRQSPRTGVISMDRKMGSPRTEIQWDIISTNRCYLNGQKDRIPTDRYTGRQSPRVEKHK